MSCEKHGIRSYSQSIRMSLINGTIDCAVKEIIIILYILYIHVQ